VVLHHPTVGITLAWSRRDLVRVLMPQKSGRHESNLRKIRRVAASLRPLDRLSRDGLQKQEPSSLAGLEGSTDPRQEMADGMAASAKCHRATH
jgi:hypothetical protein